MRSSTLDRRDREERFAAFAVVSLGAFALIVLGLLRLQVAQHDRYRQLSEENRVRLEVLRAPRGAIYDRNGELLADSYPAFNIVFRPMPAESTELVRLTSRPDWLRRLAALAEIDTLELRQMVRTASRSGQTAVLRPNAPPAVLAAIEEHRAELPGIEVVVEPLRRYPSGGLAAHLLGYAGEINEQELAKRAEEGYRPGDLIGRSGVERSNEQNLRGRDGAEYVVVNAMGRRVTTYAEVAARPPVSGQDLILTLDLKVQRAMEEAMANVQRGAAVAIDPRDGGILGMVSRPVYDPNEFSHGISQESWRELSREGSNPLLNRAIQGIYPPGSTFKIVTMIAALRSGVVHTGTRMPQPCHGSYLFGGRSFGCWKPEGHGSLDFIGALQHSCDVYFYQVGLRLGLPRLEATARGMGLGARTGVDLPQENAGLMPSPAWYDKRWGAGRWRKGVLLNLAIGQGEILTTPLQLALMTAEAAGNGRALRPHVVLRVGSGPSGGPEPGQPGVVADAAIWEAVHQAMELVVEAGTGTAARVPGIAVAGKTGTAQNPHGKDHALFVCYAPAERPTIAMCIVVENSGHGGSVAAPLAGHVLRRLFLPDSLQRPVVAARPRADSAEVSVGD